MRKYAPILFVLAAIGFASAGQAQRRRPEPFVGNVDQLAQQNNDFRRVLHTGEHTQLVLMSLRPGESIGVETHPSTDQCLFIVQGRGRVVLGGRRSHVSERSVVCVPAGVEHDVVNTGDIPMKLFTMYGPPQHPEGTIHHTRAEAARAERHAERSAQNEVEKSPAGNVSTTTRTSVRRGPSFAKRALFGIAKEPQAQSNRTNHETRKPVHYNSE
jgi:mannose-6-phosphate isomerase-like protein (cupin superfamily)